MTTTDLGHLESVDPRVVWPNEESDFTPWLSDQKNLKILGKVLKTSLEFVSREEAVGPFSADIVCRNPDDGTQVVIENQLGADESRSPRKAPDLRGALRGGSGSLDREELHRPAPGRAGLAQRGVAQRHPILRPGDRSVEDRGF